MDVIKVFETEKWTRFVYLSIFIILFLFKPSFESTINHSSLVIYLLFFFIATLIHLISQKDKNWFSLDILFLLGFAIVHFQWPIMIAFSNIEPGRHTFILADSNYINYGTWLSTIGIISWLFGYSFLKNKKISNEVEYQFNYSKLFWFTSMLFTVFLLLAGKNYLTGGIYKGEGGSSTGTGISVYFQLLFSISILILTAFIILNKKNSYKSNSIRWFIHLDKKYLFLFFFTIVLFLGVGDRGGAIQPMMAFLVLYGTLVRPIKLKEFILLIVAGALVMTLIGKGRSITSSDNILIAGASNVEITTGYDLTLELAKSSRALYKSLANVPKYHDFFFGKLWISNFLAIVPLSQNIYMQLSDVEMRETASSRYITYLMRGNFSMYGEGTTIIADIYLNFGLLGIIIFMFLLGVFFRKVIIELYLQKNYYWIVPAVVLASIAFYMGRDSLFGSIRPIVWGLLLAFLFVRRKKE